MQCEQSRDMKEKIKARNYTLSKAKSARERDGRRGGEWDEYICVLVCFQLFVVVVTCLIHCWVVLVHQRPPLVSFNTHTCPPHSTTLYLNVDLNRNGTTQKPTTFPFRAVRMWFNSIVSFEANFLIRFVGQFFSSMAWHFSWNRWFSISNEFFLQIKNRSLPSFVHAVNIDT